MTFLDDKLLDTSPLDPFTLLPYASSRSSLGPLRRVNDGIQDVIDECIFDTLLENGVYCYFGSRSSS